MKEVVRPKLVGHEPDEAGGVAELCEQAHERGSERAHSSVMRSTTPHLPQASRCPRPHELPMPSSLSSMFISKTLMDAYTKTSRLKLVLQVLGEMTSRNVVSRTMLVASLARAG
jgi:pentatricopeptide repeat protein